MLFKGQSLTVAEAQGGIYEMCFDLQESSVNKFDQATIKELEEAVTALQRQDGVVGLMITSGKKSFIVGADVGEFGALFQSPEADIAAALLSIDGLFSSIEDLPFPTVAAINGDALGGGFEICLACDFRIMGKKAKVGLPEVKLGILPGWGGTVRLPRLIGVDNGIEWIATGSNKRAAAALKDGAVDAVVAEDQLRDASLKLLSDCNDGKFDYLERRDEKREPLSLSTIERTMAFQSARGVVGAKAGPHYPRL